MASTPIIIEAESLSREPVDPGFVPYGVEINPGFLQPENVTLIRIPFGSVIGSQAKAIGNFTGETGIYTLDVIYVDSNQGIATTDITIGQNPTLSLIFDQNQEEQAGSRFLSTQSFSGLISINNSDSIELIGTSDSATNNPALQEFARIDKLIFTRISQFDFDSASTSLQEGDSGQIVIQRSNGTEGTAEVTLTLTTGANVTSDDYVISVNGNPLAGNTLNFASDETSKTITIEANDDALEESDEVLILSLAPVNGESIVGSQPSFALTILANDQPVVTPTPTPVTPNPVPVTPTPTPVTPTPPSTPVTPDPSPVTPTQTPSPSSSEEPTIVLAENINTPTNRADRIQGTKERDTIDALDGNDTVRGGRGNDIVIGGNGRDLISGGRGNDVLSGGNGRDIINGGKGADEISGGNGADTLNGGQGNDVINGGQKRDRISGGAGNDSLFGDGGRDFINGGKGNDTLQGGAGRDTLKGGAGKDTFVLELQPGLDRIIDFNIATDQLQLVDGLTFEDLEIKAMGNGTLIRSNNTRIAMLENVDADLLITDGIFS
ncbi:MAG: hypothetical protein AAGD25_14805 [Cyanobacteria bacterium P01_F01_bin.150]